MELWSLNVELVLKESCWAASLHQRSEIDDGRLSQQFGFFFVIYKSFENFGKTVRIGKSFFFQLLKALLLICVYFQNFIPGFLLFCSFIRSLELKQLFQRFARFGMALSFLLGSLAGQSFPDQLSFKLYWSLYELPLCPLSAGHSLWPALGLAAFTLDNPFERTDLKHFLFGRSHGSRGLIRNRVFVTFDGQLLPLIS